TEPYLISPPAEGWGRYRRATQDQSPSRRLGEGTAAEARRSRAESGGRGKRRQTPSHRPIRHARLSCGTSRANRAGAADAPSHDPGGDAPLEASAGKRSRCEVSTPASDRAVLRRLRMHQGEAGGGGRREPAPRVGLRPGPGQVLASSGLDRPPFLERRRLGEHRLDGVPDSRSAGRASARVGAAAGEVTVVTPYPRPAAGGTFPHFVGD